MKKVILTTIVIIVSLTSVNAQASKNPLKIGAGILFAPMASISLEKPDQGFKGIAPLFVVTSFTKGNLTIIPSYCLNVNSVNLFVTYEVSPKFSPYTVTMRGVVNKFTYTSIGATTPVWDGGASIFAEIGSDWDSKLKPVIYVGAYIPLKFKVR